ncbi:hypothetical protein G0U57_002036, partial [Chelydra serpentina]
QSRSRLCRPARESHRGSQRQSRQVWEAAGLQAEGSTRHPPLLLLGAMIIRLRHLTPGYFRLLQMQLAGGLESEPKDRLVNHLALFLAIMGLSLSYYSVRRMTDPVTTSPEQ